MRIPILIEPVSDQRYRAIGPAPDLTAEGDSSEEARERLEALLRARIAAGLTVTWFDADASETIPNHPLARHAGTWKDEPLIDEYRQAIEEYRRDRDPQAAP